MRRNRKTLKRLAPKHRVQPEAYHLPTKKRAALPEAPPIPRKIRVLKNGLIIDDWLMPFPLSSGQMTWLINMYYRWAVLDDSEECRGWLYEVLDTVDASVRRFLGNQS